MVLPTQRRLIFQETAGMTMDYREVGHYWNGNAERWTQLARAGFDVARDHLNTPAFFSMLPPVRGLCGIDIGCGEGYNTRLVADRGARVTALDISEIFLRHAHRQEEAEARGIRHVCGSATALPFAGESFDFATAFMSLMEFPETDAAMAEVYRLLKPGGFLQFSITHPCFNTNTRKNIYDDAGATVGVQIGGYFDSTDGVVSEWMFGRVRAAYGDTCPPFRVPEFNKTLSEWVTLIIAAGFRIEAMQEPCPDDAVLEEHPYLRPCRVAPFFLHFRVRKP